MKSLNFYRHNHVFHPRDKRLSDKTKDKIVSLNKAFIEVDAITDEYFPIGKGDQYQKKDKPVIRDDVRRVLKSRNPIPWTLILPVENAYLEIAKFPEIRKLNFKTKIPNQMDLLSPEAREKVVETPNDTFFLMYMSDKQIDYLRLYPYALVTGQFSSKQFYF